LTELPRFARFAAPAGRAAWSGVFARPRTVRLAGRLEEVPTLLRAAEAEAHRGRWVVLLLAYEAAPAFDQALAVRTGSTTFPLACAAVFDRPQGLSEPGHAAAGVAAPAWRARLGPAAYAAAVQRIRRYIRAGDIYQANFTFPFTGRFRGDAQAWFQQVAQSQPQALHAYIELGRWRILSFSPELFFERRGHRLMVRPMKGTAARGRWAEEDRRQALALQLSEKERAENVMIVDLLLAGVAPLCLLAKSARKAAKFRRGRSACGASALPGSEFGAAPARRSAGLGPRAPKPA